MSLDLAECKNFQPQVRTVYDETLTKLDAAFIQAKAFLIKQNFVLHSCLATPCERGTRECIIAPQIDACIKALVEVGFISGVEQIRLSMETGFSTSDGEGHSSGGYVFGRASDYPGHSGARRVYLEAKQKGYVETGDRLSEKNRKWLAHLVSGIDGLRTSDSDQEKYVYSGAVYDGEAMLVGYTTKLTSFGEGGSTHVRDAVLRGDDALKHLLLLIYFSNDFTSAVFVQRSGSRVVPKGGAGKRQKKDEDRDESSKGVPKQKTTLAAKSKARAKVPKSKPKGKWPKSKKSNTTSHVDASKRHTTSAKPKRRALGILAGPNLCSVPPSPPVERRGLTHRVLEFHEKLHPFRPLNWNDPNRDF